MRGIRPVGWGLAGVMVTGGLVAGAFRLAGTQLSQPATVISVPVGPRFLSSESATPKPEPTRTHDRTPKPTYEPTSAPTSSAPVSPTEPPHTGEHGEPVEHPGHGDD